MVACISITLMAIAVPTVVTANKASQLEGDARAIAQQLGQARMRAVSQFTRARVNFDLSGRSFQIEICTSKGTTSCQTFTPTGDPHYLASQVSFDVDGLTAPAGTQSTLEQTAAFIFNSRGIPVSASGVPTSDNAIYITDGAGNYYAVTASITSRVTMWRQRDSSWERV